MHLQESGEMYLETILVLTQLHGNVRSIDVSDYMGVSKPSVSRAIGLLKEGGYVRTDTANLLELTEAGQAVAESIYEKHTFLTDFLTRLGVDAAIAAEDACRIEHVLSEPSFIALKEHVRKHMQTEDDPNPDE